MKWRRTVKHEVCGEAMLAEAYILCELSEIDRDRFEEHYFECSECADAVRNLAQLRQGIRSGLCTSSEAATTPTRSWLMLMRQWFQGPQTAVSVAALAVAAITGYQNLQLRNQLAPQVLPSVVLQPATRGEMPQVPAGKGQFVLLEVDLPGASGNVAWSVEEPGGKVIMQGTGLAPEPGLSFKVLVPGTSLSAAQYILSVRSATGKEWLFRFRTAAR